MNPRFTLNGTLEPYDEQEFCCERMEEHILDYYITMETNNGSLDIVIIDDDGSTYLKGIKNCPWCGEAIHYHPS